MITANIAFNGYIGLSTDTKPAALNGSRFYEMDTQKSYMYDQEGGQWIEQPASGGGGAGAEPFIITIRDSGSDKTFAEVVTAFENGQTVWTKAVGQDWYDSMTNIQWNESGTYQVSFGSNVAEAGEYDGVLYWSEG